MLILLGSMALSSASVVPSSHPGPSCATSAAWQRLDEASLDLEPTSDEVAVWVVPGCTWVAPPGSRVDLFAGDQVVSGARLLGVRRAEGSILVAMSPQQSRILENQAVTAEVRTEASWLPLLEAVERAHHTSR